MGSIKLPDSCWTYEGGMGGWKQWDLLQLPNGTSERIHSWIFYLLTKMNFLGIWQSMATFFAIAMKQWSLIFSQEQRRSIAKTPDFRWRDFSLSRKIYRSVSRGLLWRVKEFKRSVRSLRTDSSKCKKYPSQYLANNISGDQQRLSRKFMTALK